MSSIEWDNTLAAASQGNREAFGEIVRRYQNMVSAVTFSVTGDLQQSEDLAQDTFVVAWEKLRELRDPAKLSGWLCGIARNLSQNWLRRTERERTQKTAQAVDDLHDNSARTSDSGEAERLAQATLVWQAIGDIPPQFREPLVMYYRENRAIADIAAALEISEANARQRIARGRKFLKAELEHRVKTALELLQPNAKFSMLVMAAIPAASILSAQTAIAATSTAVAGTTLAGKSSGTMGTVGATTMTGLPWVLAVIWTVLGAFVVPVIAIVFGHRVSVRNILIAPTVRSRRLMLRGRLFIQGNILMYAGLCFTVYMSTLSLQIRIITYAAIGELLLGTLCLTTVLTNKHWRQLIEEDNGENPMTADEIERTWLSRNTIRWTLVFALLGTAVFFTGFGWFLFGVVDDVPNTFFQFVFPWLVLLIMLSIPLSMIRVYQIGLRMACEDGLLKYPSPIPNILDVTLGRAEMPVQFRSLKGRIGGDMIGLGTMIFVSTQTYVLAALASPKPQEGYLLIGIVTVVFTIFALFFAGRPKRRHIGWVASCMMMCLVFAAIHYRFLLRETIERNPVLDIWACLIYVIFLMMAILTATSYCYLFEKEINRKLGVDDKKKTD